MEGHSESIKVAVSGAAGQIGYQLIPLICSGQMFPGRKVDLRLLDLHVDYLKGTTMEIDDCFYPNLEKYSCHSNPEEAFNDIDVAVLLGGMPRKDGMERKELLQINVGIFKVQGAALDKVAKKTCKVLVVANPANTNCLALWKNCPSIPRENFTALTRLDQNRAQHQVREHEKAKCVKNVIIWGNHSSTQFPDVRFAKVNGEDFKNTSDHYYQDEFLKTIQTRGAAVIKARGLSSAMSAAKATCDHIKDWFQGSD